MSTITKPRPLCLLRTPGPTPRAVGKARRCRALELKGPLSCSVCTCGDTFQRPVSSLARPVEVVGVGVHSWLAFCSLPSRPRALPGAGQKLALGPRDSAGQRRLSQVRLGC